MNKNDEQIAMFSKILNENNKAIKKIKFQLLVIKIMIYLILIFLVIMQIKL